jgi:hypothetical protein
MHTSPIIDSRMTFEEAVAGTAAPENIIDCLCLLTVRYRAFDGLLHEGQLVVHKTAKNDIIEIFRIIEKSEFPIARVIPIVRYNWSDDQSMAHNNTSAFNYRFVSGTERLSNHACGRAIDINPYQNPVIYGNGHVSPPGAVFMPGAAGTFFEEHLLVREFLSRGWQWGGYFTSLKDYHHFDTPG